MDVPRWRVATTPFLGVHNNTHPLTTHPPLPCHVRAPGRGCQKLIFWELVITPAPPLFPYHAINVPRRGVAKTPFLRLVKIHTLFLPYHAANVPRDARGKKSFSGSSNLIHTPLLHYRAPYVTLPRNGRLVILNLIYFGTGSYHKPKDLET